MISEFYTIVAQSSLCAAVEELEENERDLVVEIETTSNEKILLEQTNMEIRKEKDGLQSEVIELTKKCAEVQSMKEDLQRKIESELINLQNFQEQREKEVDVHKQDLGKKIKELNKERQKNAGIEAKAALSHGAQKLKSLEKCIFNIRKEKQMIITELEACMMYKVHMDHDLDFTVAALKEESWTNINI